MKLFVFTYINKNETKTSYISAHTLESAKAVFKHNLKKIGHDSFTILRISEFEFVKVHAWND